MLFEGVGRKMRGNVYINDKVYINFDIGSVVDKESDELINLSKNQLGVLELLFDNAGSTVTHDDFINKVWGYDCTNIDERHSVVDAIKSLRKIHKCFNGEKIIHTNRGFGYYVEKSVWVDDEEKIISKNKPEFDFSKKFLHSGANSLIDKSEEDIIEALNSISCLFSHICYAMHHKEHFMISNKLSDFILDLIINCPNKENNKLLKVKGPLGSYKNRLLQYIYLYISKKMSETYMIFYIDVSMYEKIKNKPDTDFKSDLQEAVSDDFKFINNSINSDKNRIPIVIIDGVRDFSNGKDFLYSFIQKAMYGVDCKMIVGIDTDFTNNPRHKYRVHPFVTTDYEYYIRIKSLELYQKQYSIDFINDCINIFGIKVPDNYTSELIYDRLVKLNLISIDAYWLKNLLDLMIVNIMNEDYTISDLYETLCIRTLQSNDMIDSAAELAYQYEYGNMDFSDSEFFFDDRWKLIRKHRSVLDYLLARNYIIQFEKLQQCIDCNQDIKENLKFFNLVLPKNITRFVVVMLNELDDYENTIMNIARYHYSDMATFGRNELVFWLGRLKNNNRKNESVVLLKKFFNDQYYDYIENMDSSDLNELKKKAFLLRTISVSLIYRGDKEVAKYYLNALLKDKLFNKLNRGFHLEYYGDKLYIPNKTMLDFEDDVTKGENTFNSLCIQMDSFINNKKITYNSILELMTLCSLIQARMENICDIECFSFDNYINKVIHYLDWILKQRMLMEFPFVREYFSWMRLELLDQYTNKGIQYSKSDVFNIYYSSKNVKRAGWVKRGVSSAENIVDHMYMCWLMGLMYLPEKIENTEYSKQKILNMLLIHDLGETITGDIPTPEKNTDRDYYDNKEKEVMRRLILTSTYPSMSNMDLLRESWNEWSTESNYNVDIAKDIDELQAIYQLCIYYKEVPDTFDFEDVREWIGQINYLRTDIVRNIADILIKNNPIFNDIIREFKID